MADNVILNPGVGGVQMATKDDGTSHHQQILTEFLDNADAPQQVSPRVGLPITLADDGVSDAFHRVRTSIPATIFDSKLLWDAQPLLWDDQETAGAGTSSVHSTDTASSTMSTSLNTAGTRVRQTFQRFNYHPGKSELVFMTGTFGVGVSGITRRIGLFDDNDGLFFNQIDGTFGVTIRSSTSGSPVDNTILQASWNLDTLDGNGPSGVTLNLANSQIFVIDFQWLGSGRVRFGFEISGRLVYVHEFLRANLAVNPYMSTPNLPLRYEISSGAASPASDLVHTCATVMIEGDVEITGVTRLLSSGSTGITTPTVGVTYAIKGVRLKATQLDASILIESIGAFISAGNTDMGEWLLIHNPVVAGTFTYADVPDSPLQEATGVAANTVTLGTTIDGGYLAPARQGASSAKSVPSALGLGSAIDGTPDTLVLCFRPITSGPTVHGQILARELS